MNINILHVTPYYTPAYAFGGVVRAVEGMTRGLVRRGHTVTVLTTDALTRDDRYRGADVDDEMLDGVRVVRARNISRKLRGAANLSTPFEMRQIAPNLIRAADVIHCHEFRTFENLIVTPLAARLNKPLILSPHGTLTWETGRGGLKALWDRLISPTMARRFSGVIGLTEAETSESQVFWDRVGVMRENTQFFTLPNGVDPSAFTRSHHPPRDEIQVLFLGRLHPRKGIDLLIRAFQVANVPDSRLIIAGPDEGMLETLRSLSAGDARIAFVGYVSGDNRLDVLANADIFALPAIGEGMPMAALEAMAAGLPVILSPECNLPEAAAYQAGFVVEREIQPIADALRSLLTNDQLRRDMGERGRVLVKEQFTWDSAAAALERVYQPSAY